MKTAQLYFFLSLASVILGGGSGWAAGYMYVKHGMAFVWVLLAVGVGAVLLWDAKGGRNEQV
jgi:hypothetical protein